MSLWLRDETKDNEKRTPLTPSQVSGLIKKGHQVIVEKSVNRIFNDSEYENAGAKLMTSGSWKEAPLDFYILGLKELPEEDFELRHKHIYFAHVFKKQDGYKKTLGRFLKGKGELFDLEYLVNDSGRRIAAFGKWAGFVGTAIGIDAFFHQQLSNSPYPKLKSFDKSSQLIESIKKKQAKCKEKPKVMIIGHKGRCGQGATEVVKELNLECSLWDTQNTSKGGPFTEILDHQIFINAALILKKTKPFLDESILTSNQKLKIIADVGCDPTSNLNPVPLYSSISSFNEPFIHYRKNNISLDILAVDNLPTVLPKESSQDFAEQLYPHLLEVLDTETHSLVFKNALQTFQNAIAELA